MGRAAQHFGHDAKDEGRQAARDLADGKITREQFREKYKDAKFRGDSDRFKQGYAEGADEKMTK